MISQSVVDTQDDGDDNEGVGVSGDYYEYEDETVTTTCSKQDILAITACDKICGRREGDFCLQTNEFDGIVCDCPTTTEVRAFPFLVYLSYFQ